MTLFFSSCEFRKSYQKDLINGTTAKGDGLSCEVISMEINGRAEERNSFKDLINGTTAKGDGLSCEVISMEINGRAEERNSFVFGENVNLMFNEMSGFTKENGNVFPGLSMYIVNNEKDTVLSEPDLITDFVPDTGLTLQLQTNFIAALLHNNDEKYIAYINIWDKKGDGTFSYKMPFTVKDAGLLDVTANQVSNDNIYLWNESDNAPVLDKNINQEDVLMLILEGVTGFKEINGMVFPEFSIELTDKKRNIILKNPDLFSKYEATGIRMEDLKKQAHARITFQKGRVESPCTLKAVLKDRHSEKQIVVETELEIIE